MTTETLPQKQVFHCDNLTLAITLKTAGCEWANDGKHSICGLNKYTLAFIRSHPLYEKMKGLSHEDAIRYLWRNGQPGNITYCFERSEALKLVCDGWDSQAAPADDKPIPGVEIDERTFGAVAYKISQMRTKFVGSKSVKPFWRDKDESGNLFVPAIAHTIGASSTESTGDRSTRTVIRDARMKAVEV